MGRFKAVAIGALGVAAVVGGVASAGTLAISASPTPAMTAEQAQAKIEHLHQRLSATRSMAPQLEQAPASVPQGTPAAAQLRQALASSEPAAVAPATTVPPAPAVTPTTSPASNDDAGTQVYDDDYGYGDDRGYDDDAYEHEGGDDD